MKIKNLGMVDYAPTFEAMKQFNDHRTPDTEDELWLVEHPPVFTQGLAGKPEHLLFSGSIPVVQIDRGGQITYHGPGQLVVYPIVRTPEGSDVVAFVRALEGAVIAALAAFSIRGERVGGRSGVWCGGNKICAIGVKFSRNTTLHGLALNVATDLEKFTRIVPCGISDAGVASMESLGRAATLDEAAEALLPELSSALGAFQLRTEGR